MDEHGDLITQLETAMAGKSVSRRAEALRRVTDLFVLGSGKFSDDQVGLFGEIMSALTRDIELSVRMTISNNLSKLRDAPRGMIRTLAFDEAIEVAGPVLRDSPQLDEVTLVECSRTMGQAHLLAISGRSVLTEPITDVLIDRGDRTVVTNLVDNRGARLSESGVSALVSKTSSDGELAEALWLRPDIPRREVLNLFVQASAAVRERLQAADPRKVEQMRAAARRYTDAIQAIARNGSHEHKRALSEVRALNAEGKLNEPTLVGFAKNGSFDRVAVALSLMCNLPIELIERALVDKQPEQIIVFARAINLSWETVKGLLVMQAAPGHLSNDQAEQLFKNYSKLQVKTAQNALHFYRLRDKARDPASAETT